MGIAGGSETEGKPVVMLWFMFELLLAGSWPESEMEAVSESAAGGVCRFGFSRKEGPEMSSAVPSEDFRRTSLRPVPADVGVGLESLVSGFVRLS